MFCQKALSQLAEQREWIAAQGWQLVLVHLTSKENADSLHRALNLTEVPQVSDPQRELYRAFQLGHISVSSMLSPQLWKQSLHALMQGFRHCQTLAVGSHGPADPYSVQRQISHSMVWD